MKISTFISLMVLLPATLMAQGWQPVSSLPNNYFSDHSYGFALDDTGYLVSGNTNAGYTNAFYSYAADTDTWTQLDDFPGTARGYAIGDTWDGKAWMGFGLSDDGAMNDLWVYDPETDTWTEKASCPCTARYHPAFVAIDGKIYMGLGGTGTNNLKDWWEYDMESDAWTQLEDFPDVPRHHPYQFGVDGKVYVGLGHGDGIFNTWYAYDPANAAWEQMANLPGEGRVAGTQFAHQEYGYVLSGDGEDHSSMETGEFYRYDPLTDTWAQLPAHPGMSRWAPASFIVNDEVYLINGMSLDPGTFDYMTTNWKFALTPSAVTDASVSSYEGVTEVCGEGDVPVSALITNWGSDVLTAAEIALVQDGSTVLSVNWSGNLETFMTESVSLGDLPVDGSTSFELVVTALNDEVAENNALEASIAGAPSGSNVWTIAITTDDWGEETGWLIEDETGSIVASQAAGGYGNLTLYEEEVTLPGTGCYTFILTDTYGDGMNGEIWGGSNGSCVVTATDGSGSETVLVEYDGNFGFFQQPWLTEVSEIASSVDAIASEAPQLDLGIASQQNGDLQLWWEATNTSANLDLLITDLTGKVVWSGSATGTPNVRNTEAINTSQWAKGTYLVRASNGLHTATLKWLNL